MHLHTLPLPHQTNQKLIPFEIHPVQGEGTLSNCFKVSAIMEMGRLCSSGNGGDVCCSWSRCYSTRDYDRFVSYSAVQPSRSKATIWTQLWRKIKREKKKMFDYSSASMRFSYDPYTYSQNFDQGLTWSDPDDLSRSFSARFAVPSRIFADKDVLVI